MTKDLTTIRGRHQFSAAYANSFSAYLTSPSEKGLHDAYELGRKAVGLGLGLLDVAQIHHRTLHDAIEHVPARRAAATVDHGGAFFAEALSAFEMLARVHREERERAALERRHASIVRQLSTLLADAALAADATTSLAETLQLVVEAAHEMSGASGCLGTVGGSPDRGELTVVAGDANAEGGRLTATIRALDGEELGSLTLVAAGEKRFTELHKAVLEHLAQMAAAAIERARFYTRA